MSDSAGAIASTYSRPAFVRATLRVVRLKRRTPSLFSRLETALPIAVGDTSRSMAAARKLPSLDGDHGLEFHQPTFVHCHDSLDTTSQFISIIATVKVRYGATTINDTKAVGMPKAPITNITFGTMTLGYRGYGARVHDAATADAMLG